MGGSVVVGAFAEERLHGREEERAGGQMGGRKEKRKDWQTGGGMWMDGRQVGDGRWMANFHAFRR